MFIYNLKRARAIAAAHFPPEQSSRYWHGRHFSTQSPAIANSKIAKFALGLTAYATILTGTAIAVYTELLREEDNPRLQEENQEKIDAIAKKNLPVVTWIDLFE